MLKFNSMYQYVKSKYEEISQNQSETIKTLLSMIQSVSEEKNEIRCSYTNQNIPILHKIVEDLKSKINIEIDYLFDKFNTNIKDVARKILNEFSPENEKCEFLIRREKQRNLYESQVQKTLMEMSLKQVQTNFITHSDSNYTQFHSK